jgi:hypothetical protein
LPQVLLEHDSLSWNCVEVVHLKLLNVRVRLAEDLCIRRKVRLSGGFSVRAHAKHCGRLGACEHFFNHVQTLLDELGRLAFKISEIRIAYRQAYEVVKQLHRVNLSRVLVESPDDLRELVHVDFTCVTKD